MKYYDETPIGGIFLTNRISSALNENADFDIALQNILERFLQDDFGVTSEEDVEANFCALRVQQGSVYAKYEFEPEELVVVTRFDDEDDCRSVTVVLFSSEEGELNNILKESFEER